MIYGGVYTKISQKTGFQVKLSNLDNLNNLTKKWPKNGHSGYS